VGHEGSAYVYSGKTGALLYQKNGGIDDGLGYRVGGAGDVNGDGWDDFIVGTNAADPGGLINAGSAYVYSGATGGKLHQKDGAAASDFLGFSVAGVGDVNGDEKDDFIIGAPFADPGGLINAGSAYVYSGATGDPLPYSPINGTAIGDILGATVAGCGDVNGDEVPDFIVGAPFADPGGRSAAGSAYVYSGATGALLHQKDGAAAGDQFGRNPGGVGGAGDVNGDGKDDFIVGAFNADPGGRTEAGSAYLYSGADGALLCQKDGAAAGDALGISVNGAGDLNSDGKGEYIIGAYAADPGGLTNAGTAFVYELDMVPPTITCPTNIVRNNDLNQCCAAATFAPTIGDNCPGVTFVCSPPTGTCFPLGMTTVNCTATDVCGNQSFCSFTVTVNDNIQPSITCPGPIPVQCVVDVPPAATTVAELVAQGGSASDNCGPVTITSSDGALAGGPCGGTITRTYTATDAFSNFFTCDQIITVNDNTPPMIASCPDINKPCAPTTVTFAPTASDNCPSGATVNCTPSSGSLFQPGVTPVTCIATDACGNKDTCTFTVRVCESNTIFGKKFNDANLNCDPTQNGLFQWPIVLKRAGQAAQVKLTNQNGNYLFSNLSTGSYTIKESNLFPWNWNQTCPVSPGTHTVNLSAEEIVTGINFGNRDLMRWDLAVGLGATPAFPGRTQAYYAYYRNYGTVASPPATLTLTLPPEVATPPLFISDGGTYANGNVTWNLGSVPGQSPVFLRYTYVGIPSNVPVGAVLKASDNLVPTAGDSYIPNNSYTYRAKVRSLSLQGQQALSFLPNDKTVFPEGSAPSGIIAKTDTLLYQVNFQNVGTDTVRNVVVRDTLDDNLDIETIEIQAASHLYDFTIDGRELIWTFTNMNLPDSNVDEPGSHAFVTYTVQPDSNAVGLDIHNRATIYIDSTPPVVTNTVTNQICAAAKGDMNADGILTSSDVVLILNCTFLGTGNCDLCFADLNCDGILTASDVVNELNLAFLGTPINCGP